MKIVVLAIGKTRGPETDWCNEYLKRLGNSVTLKGISISSRLPPHEAQKAEAGMLLTAIPNKAFVVLLDERGKDLSSRDLAAKISSWQMQGLDDVIFIVGGADGVTDAVRARANLILSFGRSTWPHRLVRVMILEQIYRALQIIAGHPYHRD